MDVNLIGRKPKVFGKERGRLIVHLPVPKINSPGGADTASGEYTLLRSVA